MKTYAICDADRKTDITVGFLFYYEKAKAFIIELNDNLDEWEAPLLFQKLVRENVYTIPKDIASMWVGERIIPSGRQNIGSILKNSKMNSYDEMKFLERSKGKCSQDNCYIEHIFYEDIPDTIRKRSMINVSECFYANEKNIICMFRDNLVRKINLSKLEKCIKDIKFVLENEALLKSVKVGVGGYSITFNNSMEIPVLQLRDEAFSENLVADDFFCFVKNNIADTTKVCEIMNCTRQNLSYLSYIQKLKPVLEGKKERLFTLGCVEKAMQE